MNPLAKACCKIRYVFSIHTAGLNPFMSFISNKNLNSWPDWILSDANFENQIGKLPLDFIYLDHNCKE